MFKLLPVMCSVDQDWKEKFILIYKNMYFASSFTITLIYVISKILLFVSSRCFTTEPFNNIYLRLVCCNVVGVKSKAHKKP